MSARSFTRIERSRWFARAHRAHELRSKIATTALAIAALVGCKRDAGQASMADAAKAPLKVAAAADLATAFAEVGSAYEKKTGQKVVFSFGSTGLLAKQISQGAPFDLFAAANKSFVDEVVKDKSCVEGTEALYARGRIVVWTRRGAAKVNALGDLQDARFAKIAIANPEHAPYGQAAKQALEKTGVWSAIEKRVVYGENVQQTLQYAQSGNADAAIVALSLAVATPDGEYLAIDPELHAPLDQALVVCRGAPGLEGDAKAAQEKDARAFVAFVSAEEGRSIMRHYGFLLPGDSLSAAKPSAP